MTTPGVATRAHPAAEHGSVSIPILVLAAVLVGLGLLGMAYWLITFQWALLASVIPLALGGLLLFTPRTGPDRA
ncbi:MAG TPA: hypothetical protein VEH57_03380 [Thermoplasmata archaeon]|nr:hypothetical protein [Thermoplasmata archaeon]